MKLEDALREEGIELPKKDGGYISPPLSGNYYYTFYIKDEKVIYEEKHTMTDIQVSVWKQGGYWLGVKK